MTKIDSRGLLIASIYLIAGSGCAGVDSSLTSLGVANALQPLFTSSDAISTNFADSKSWDAPGFVLPVTTPVIDLARMPRTPSGAFLVAPGFYEMVSRSYCLHAGDAGPSEGDGYKYAPLAGDRATVIQAIVLNSGRSSVPQTAVQLLIWAVLSKTSFKELSSDLQKAALTLLTPKQIFDLNGGALGLIPDSVIEKAIAGLPDAVQQSLIVENRLRALFASGSSTYEDFERIAVPLNVDRRTSFPAGQWSMHPDGYYLRYYPDGYTRTKVQIYVPRKPRDAVGARSADLGRLVRVSFAGVGTADASRPVIYDATASVAVPADTSAQRLQQSNDAAVSGDGGAPNKYSPCAIVDSNNSQNTDDQTSGTPSEWQSKIDAEKDIATSNHWNPNSAGFATENEAGSAAIFYIDKQSVTANVEYAGYIYENPTNGKYYFSTPVTSNEGSSSQPSNSPVPAGEKIVASYHTHAGHYAISDEYFSPQDIVKGALQHLDSYLGTPEGKVLKFDPSEPSVDCRAAHDTGSISQLVQ